MERNSWDATEIGAFGWLGSSASRPLPYFAMIYSTTAPGSASTRPPSGMTGANHWTCPSQDLSALIFPFDVVSERRKLPVPKFFKKCHLPCIAGRARVHALLKESTLHWAAGQSERGLEVFACGLRPPASKLKLTKRRGVEGMGGETIAVANGTDFRKPLLRAIPLGYGDGSVQLDDRGGIDRHQFVVE